MEELFDDQILSSPKAKKQMILHNNQHWNNIVEEYHSGCPCYNIWKKSFVIVVLLLVAHYHNHYYSVFLSSSYLFSYSIGISHLLFLYHLISKRLKKIYSTKSSSEIIVSVLTLWSKAQILTHSLNNNLLGTHACSSPLRQQQGQKTKFDQLFETEYSPKTAESLPSKALSKASTTAAHVAVVDCNHMDKITNEDFAEKSEGHNLKKRLLCYTVLTKLMENCIL